MLFRSHGQDFRTGSGVGGERLGGSHQGGFAPLPLKEEGFQGLPDQLAVEIFGKPEAEGTHAGYDECRMQYKL